MMSPETRFGVIRCGHPKELERGTFPIAVRTCADYEREPGADDDKGEGPPRKTA